MTKNQKFRKSKQRRVRASRGIVRDPNFTHTLTADITLAVSTPTAAAVIPVTPLGLSGFPQLATFFECFVPRSYRIKFSYTNWSGTLAFVPLNPFTSTAPSASSLLTTALREVRGAIRVQQGYNNTGALCTYPYPNQGWQCASIGSNVIGYIAAFNDGVLPLANWTIQCTIEVDIRFMRRNLLFTGSVAPT